MKMKKVLIALGVLVVLFGALSIFNLKRADAPQNVNNESINAATVTNGTSRMTTIEGYVTANISRLSPMPEVLGGTFYITSLEAHGGAGTVSYEDGHNAYVADFTYSTDEATGVSVSDFVVRK